VDKSDLWKKATKKFAEKIDEEMVRIWKAGENSNSSSSKKARLDMQQIDFDKYRSYVDDFVEQHPECLHLPPKWLLERFLKFLHDGGLMGDAF